MEERLGEIAGTLARTKERKNTILYKAVQRKREEEKLARLGVNRLPSNPRETADPKVIRFVISQLQSEIGERIEKLRRPVFISIEKDGESAVRVKNDEVNQLLAKKHAWEMRLAFVTDGESPPFQRRKFFFGCAKELPEAIVQKRGREGEEEEESSDDGVAEALQSSSPHGEKNTRGQATHDADDARQELIHGYYEAISMLASEDTDAKLLLAEKEAEKKFKSTNGAPQNYSSLATASSPTKYVSSYVQDGKLQLPDEQEYSQAQIERKRQALLGRLQSLKESRSSS